MITIASKKDGFRRCGVAHPKKETGYPNDHFTEDELAILRLEPMLTVVEKNDQPSLKANEAIALAKACGSIEELDRMLADGETRKSVLEAIAARQQALEAANV